MTKHGSTRSHFYYHTFYTVVWISKYPYTFIRIHVAAHGLRTICLSSPHKIKKNGSTDWKQAQGR